MPPPVVAARMMPDLDLMASMAQVAAMPILPSEIGTAVIFTPKAPEPEPQAEAQPSTETTAEIRPMADILEKDLLEEDPAEFLYEPDPDPAADLLEPISFVPQPKPAPAPPPKPAAALPSAEPTHPPADTLTHDPLGPLKAMSDVEKIALFS